MSHPGYYNIDFTDAEQALADFLEGQWTKYRGLKQAEILALYGVDQIIATLGAERVAERLNHWRTVQNTDEIEMHGACWMDGFLNGLAVATAQEQGKL